MRCHHKHAKHQRHKHRPRGNEVGRREREMLRQHSARKDANAETQVPGGEIGGRGRAALSMGAQVDEQGIERREGRAESQSTA